MRRIAVLALALCLGCAPAFAADPAPAPAPVPDSMRASDADIDRLLQVMDAKSMMDKLMQQMATS